MSLGLVGRKVGMTRIFADDGTSIPVTVVDVADNRVTQIKTPESDGYSAVQVAYGQRRASRLTKAVAGHYAKAGVEAASKQTTSPSCKSAAQSPLKFLPWGKKSTSLERPKVKASRALSSVTTFPVIVHHTVTRVHTMCRAPSAWRKIRVAFSQVSACQAIWVTSSAPRCSWKSLASTPVANCC
jgi:hypothetical protein